MPHSFTPGPWETLKFSQHELQTDFAMVKIGERVHMIGYSDEDKANARLIASAPDLLAAVQYAADVFSGYVDTHKAMGDMGAEAQGNQQHLQVMLEAIAKAEDAV